ncbi:MAG: hypothetical protein AAGF11_03495 [Myxococcota bacterium]
MRRRVLAATFVGHLGAAGLVAAGLVAAGLGGCADRAEEPAPGSFATPREDDPPLVESWRLPPGTSPLRSGDLGSTPVELSTALMLDHAAAGISHRIARRCAEKGALANVGSLALRFSVGAGGTVGAIEGDPAGPAAACTVKALRAELSARPPMPAGAALMVLRFWVEPGP